jgi:hypothetical protein
LSGIDGSQVGEATIPTYDEESSEEVTMRLKLIPLGCALLLPIGGLVALACGDDDDDPGGGGRGGRGGAAGTAGAAGAGTGGGGNAGTGGADGGSDARAEAGAPDSRMNFFVSSQGSATGDLGGLAGADARCQSLAAAVGMGGTWVAYLSAELADGGAVHARERIGPGPYFNFYGVLLANDAEALHARTGDADLFVDERGNKIPGQWPGSPRPIEHDILTGTNPEGRLAAGFTCSGWTSNTPDAAAMVGHSDGIGPGGDAGPPFSSWHSSHASAGCNDTAPRGGSGRVYCFSPP